MADERSPEEWGDVYRERRREFKALTAKVEALLPDLLGHEHIDVSSLESRTKKVESFVEKLARKEGKYNEPLEQVTDLCGFRIITYYREDVDRVLALLRREFAIDEQNSEDKTANLDPDRFGYSSVHLVAALGPGRSTLPEWSPYAGFKWEFQIRTAVQHAWAAVEHKLHYKAVAEVPRDLQRQLYRLSALFELADEQFSALRTSVEALKADYQEKVNEGDLAIAIDADSLSAYLETAPRVEAALNAAVAAGFQVRDADTLSKSRIEKNRRDLLRALQMCDIATIQEFDALLARLTKSQKGRLKKTAQELPDDPPFRWSQGQLLRWLVFVSVDADPDLVGSFFAERATDSYRRAQQSW